MRQALARAPRLRPERSKSPASITSDHARQGRELTSIRPANSSVVTGLSHGTARAGIDAGPGLEQLDGECEAEPTPVEA